jgi:branched-chain amino acid transport system substrate-binding protein
MRTATHSIVCLLAISTLVIGCSSDDNAGVDTTLAAPTSSAPLPTESPVQETSTATEAPVSTDAATASTTPDTAAPDECGEPAAGEAVKVGHINSTSGPINIPSAGYAVEVALDRYNECGGFNGRPVELETRDGGLDPGLSASAARDLVEQENVVGFVGNNAFLDCLNGAYYVEAGVANIGSNFDGSCYQNANIFPTQPNYDANIFPGVRFALDQGKTKFAYVALDIPGQRLQADAIKAFVETQGATLDTSVFVPFGSTDASTAMQTIAQSGVDAVIMSVDETLFGAAAATAVQQGVGPDTLAWIAPTGLYSPKALAALGDAGEGLYVVTNYDVAENDNEVAAGLGDDILANHPDAQVDGFAQLGWISAETFLAALDAIEGDLTSESLLAAMNGLGPVQSALLPEPIVVNSPIPRSLGSQALILQIKSGAYVVASDGFVNYPS